MTHLIIFFFCICLFCLPIYLKAATPSPHLMLSKTTSLQELTDIQHYWISEKYDGVRAHWTGSQLLTKQGNPITAPDWFVAQLPNEEVEGELWIERNKFDLVSGIIRKKQPIDAEWQQIQFMLFDLPQSKLPFELRQKRLKNLITSIAQPWLKHVEFFQLTTVDELELTLHEFVMKGAEGLMLNQAESYYETGRQSQLLKLKPYFDDEAVVIKHLPGKGKYQGAMGALLVKNTEGTLFKIGTGFSDQERQFPPAIGETITYKYRGITKNGLPKFASFLRTRNDL